MSELYFSCRLFALFEAPFLLKTYHKYKVRIVSVSDE